MSSPQTPERGKTRDMLGRQGLVSVDEARTVLKDRLGPLGKSETVALAEALDRVTAEAVSAPEDLPNHPRATMDGYAVIAADTYGASESTPCYLPLRGEVLMGEMPSDTVERGRCMRIATGGLLPAGANAVVMYEHTVPVDDTMIEIVKGVGAGANIIGVGDDIRAGDTALPAGQKLRPQDLGLLAGLGITEVAVVRRPRLGILSTGDEIVPHDGPAEKGKIRNINAIALGSQARRLGAEVHDYGIVTDEKESFFAAVEKAAKENDLVLFSGGSSVGTRDLGEEAIARLGSPGVLVHGVALRPGKPLLIGLHEETPIFGLPGHPVSAMVCFDLFVSLALSILSGLTSQPVDIHPVVEARLGRNIASAAGRRDIVRVKLLLENGRLTAQPVLGKSGAISTLSRSHGYLVVAEPLQGLSVNTPVKVHLYL